MVFNSRSEEEKFDELRQKELLLKKLQQDLARHDIEKEKFKEMMNTLTRLLSEKE